MAVVTLPFNYEPRTVCEIDDDLICPYRIPGQDTSPEGVSRIEYYHLSTHPLKVTLRPTTEERISAAIRLLQEAGFKVEEEKARQHDTVRVTHDFGDSSDGQPKRSVTLNCSTDLKDRLKIMTNAVGALSSDPSFLPKPTADAIILHENDPAALNAAAEVALAAR